jgi:hypothetical protein
MDAGRARHSTQKTPARDVEDISKLIAELAVPVYEVKCMDLSGNIVTAEFRQSVDNPAAWNVAVRGDPLARTECYIPASRSFCAHAGMAGLVTARYMQFGTPHALGWLMRSGEVADIVMTSFRYQANDGYTSTQVRAYRPIDPEQVAVLEHVIRDIKEAVFLERTRLPLPLVLKGERWCDPRQRATLSIQLLDSHGSWRATLQQPGGPTLTDSKFKWPVELPMQHPIVAPPPPPFSMRVNSGYDRREAPLVTATSDHSIWLFDTRQMDRDTRLELCKLLARICLEK